MVPQLLPLLTMMLTVALTVMLVVMMRMVKVARIGWEGVAVGGL